MFFTITTLFLILFVENGASAQFEDDFKKYERDYVTFSKEKLEESLKIYKEQYSTRQEMRNKL